MEAGRHSSLQRYINYEKQGSTSACEENLGAFRRRLELILSGPQMQLLLLLDLGLVKLHHLILKSNNYIYIFLLFNVLINNYFNHSFLKNICYFLKRLIPFNFHP